MEREGPYIYPVTNELRHFDQKFLALIEEEEEEKEKGSYSRFNGGISSTGMFVI